MRHLTVLIVALLCVSLPAGWAVAGDALTDHEMDAVSAAGSASDASNLASILSVQLFSRIRTSQILNLIGQNALEIDFANGSQTLSVTYGKTNVLSVSFNPLAINGGPVPFPRHK